MRVAGLRQRGRCAGALPEDQVVAVHVFRVTGLRWQLYDLADPSKTPRAELPNERGGGVPENASGRLAGRAGTSAARFGGA